MLTLILLLIYLDSAVPELVSSKVSMSAALRTVERIERLKVTVHTDKVSSVFIKKVMWISDSLKIKSDWLMEVMWTESRLNSKAENNIGAVGLIQFLPSTALGLRTTSKDLLAMSGTQQLSYVYKYFKRAKGLIHSTEDLHLYAFFPAAILESWKDDAVLKTDKISAGRIAKLNPKADINKDNMITVGEYKQAVKSLN